MPQPRSARSNPAAQVQFALPFFPRKEHLSYLTKPISPRSVSRGPPPLPPLERSESPDISPVRKQRQRNEMFSPFLKSVSTPALRAIHTPIGRDEGEKRKQSGHRGSLSSYDSRRKALLLSFAERPEWEVEKAKKEKSLAKLRQRDKEIEGLITRVAKRKEKDHAKFVNHMTGLLSGLSDDQSSVIPALSRAKVAVEAKLIGLAALHKHRWEKVWSAPPDRQPPVYAQEASRISFEAIQAVVEDVPKTLDRACGSLPPRPPMRLPTTASQASLPPPLRTSDVLKSFTSRGSRYVGSSFRTTREGGGGGEEARSTLGKAGREAMVRPSSGRVRLTRTSNVGENMSKLSNHITAGAPPLLPLPPPPGSVEAGVSSFDGCLLRLSGTLRDSENPRRLSEKWAGMNTVLNMTKDSVRINHLKKKKEGGKTQISGSR